VALEDDRSEINIGVGFPGRLGCRVKKCLRVGLQVGCRGHRQARGCWPLPCRHHFHVRRAQLGFNGCPASAAKDDGCSSVPTTIRRFRSGESFAIACLIGRTTATGQLASCTHFRLTDPSLRPLNPPSPREPTTSRSAPSPASIRAVAANPPCVLLTGVISGAIWRPIRRILAGVEETSNRTCRTTRWHNIPGRLRGLPRGTRNEDLPTAILTGECVEDQPTPILTRKSMTVSPRRGFGW